jgi:hypothetical protein
MGFQSQAGHVGMKTQAAKGTFEDVINGLFFRTKSGAMGGSRELLIPDPEIGGGRDVPDAYLGPIAFKGSYDFYARMEMLSLLLWGALGVKQAATSGGVTTHTITPTDTSLPWFSVEERIGDGYEAFKYTDTKVSSFHLEAEANGYLMGTVELIALQQESVGASFTQLGDREYDTTPMVVGSNIIVEFGGVALPAKSFSLDINNNLEDDDFRLGSFFLGDLVEKRREFTLGVTIRPEDGDLWRLATYGDANATTAQGTIVKDDVHILCQTYETIPGSSPATLYELDIAVPTAAIAPFEVNPSGDDVLQHDLEIRCLRPDPAIDIVEFAVKNALTAIP